MKVDRWVHIYSTKDKLVSEEVDVAPVPQWIPVTERPPEKEAYYLITYGGAVTWQHWLHNRWYGMIDGLKFAVRCNGVSGGKV